MPARVQRVLAGLNAFLHTLPARMLDMLICMVPGEYDSREVINGVAQAKHLRLHELRLPLSKDHDCQEATTGQTKTARRRSTDALFNGVATNATLSSPSSHTVPRVKTLQVTQKYLVGNSALMLPHWYHPPCCACHDQDQP
jgi:hypothetical protein